MSVHPPSNAISALSSVATEQSSPADQSTLLGTLLENITDAFFALDSEWRFLYINRRAEQMWHIPREQLLGSSLWEAFPEAADSPFYHYYHKAVAEQRSLTFETPYAPERWAEVHVYPSKAGLSVYLIDITGRKREEKLLHEREETLQAIIAASADDITIINPNLRVDFVSPVVREVLGYTSEQRQDRDALENIHPEDRALVARELRAILSRTQESSQFRFRTQHADGTWIVLESNARPITDAEGRALGAIAVSRDVTEQAQLEESLRQAKQEAVRAIQAKNDFLSRTSHELRTPLNAIIGFSQLLEMDIENPQQRESVQHIHRAGHHLLELINEVLDISRIETDRLALSLKAVQVSSCLEEVTSLLQPLFVQSGVQLHTDASVQNSQYVLADAKRLKQILLNLLSNAAKYNRAGGTVTVSCETPRHGWLCLNVADMGIGIPTEKLGRLFAPFDRLDAERTTVEGAGLGLALSKRLAEAMNGALGVTSEVGVGSTFWIELPLTKKDTGEHIASSEAT